MIRFNCDHCGAAFRVAQDKAGRKGRCPKCKGVMQIPKAHLEPEEDIYSFADDAVDEQTPAATSSVDPMPGLTDGQALQEQHIEAGGGANPYEHRPASEPGAEVCPGCGRGLEASQRICAPCGIQLPSGRPLLTVSDREDQVHYQAERVIRAISWLIGWGVFPLWSEAKGRVRPLATWGIAALTIIVSIWFWTTETSYGWGPHGDLMLWSGETEQARLQVRGPWVIEILPYESKQLLTHMLLHGDIFHLGGNLLFLMIFGSRINSVIGNAATLVCYICCGVVAGAVWRATMAGNPPMPMVGASGAIMGLCGMYLVMFPLYRIYMAFWWRWGLFAGFRLSHKIWAARGFWVVLAYIALDAFYLGLGADDGVAHWAHIGGFLTGVALATGLLAARLANCPGNVFSTVLGRHAFALVGKPRQDPGPLTRYAPSFLRVKE
jgi:predicted Zn finger-like uncharacterized protein